MRRQGASNSPSLHPTPFNLAFLSKNTYIGVMRTLSSTDLRADLSSVMDRVNDDHEPVIVTRAKG